MTNIIKQYLEEAVLQGVFPGCCVAVQHHGKIDYYCVGQRELLPDKVNNTLDTIYDLASLSKVVSTTMIILQLIQQGKLKYGTLIKSILPLFNHEEVTIFHLLTHTSGLPADLSCGLDANKQKMFEDIYQTPLDYSCGSKVLYSDIGFILLGEIIEQVTKQPLQQAAFQYVFEPLNMKGTVYCPSDAQYPRCASTEMSIHFQQMLKGTVHDRKGHLMNGVAGHAGVFSTIYDMARYMNMLLQGGKVNGKVYLEEKYLHDLWTTVTPASEIHRGIGFLTKDGRSPFSNMNTTRSILHTGFTGTSILVDFQHRIGIVILSNRVHPTRENQQILSWRRKFHDIVMKYYCK